MKATAVSRTIFVYVAYLIVACSILQSYLTHWSYMLSSDLDLALTFSTPRPYVYRVLSPLIVKGVAAFVPARVGAGLLDNWGRGVVALSVMRYGYAGRPSIEFLVSLWLMLGSLWGTMFIWRALVAWALPGRPMLADTAPAVAMLILPATFVGGAFLYDFPDLFFVSACFLAFVKKRWSFWYVLLPLTVLNKEASVLVVVWWLAVYRSLPKRTWWTHATLSAAVGGAVVAGLWWIFRSKVGYVAQPNFAHNVRFWLSLRWLFRVQDSFGLGLPLPVAFHFVNLLLGWGIWSRARRRVQPDVLRALGSSVLVIGLLMLPFGFEDEIRVFAIAWPPMVVLVAAALDSLYEDRTRAAEA